MTADLRNYKDVNYEAILCKNFEVAREITPF